MMGENAALDEDPLDANESAWNASSSPNPEYIFNRSDVRLGLVLVYTFVFCCCFFGNLLVIVVVVLHRRMRTVTNFFLTNLAFADLCVGVFCVYQNLSFYLTDRWWFGEFLCKMYHFVHSLSYTASILILTVICVERYLAILHPIWSRKALTLARLRTVIVGVWLFSAGYCCPRIVMYGTIELADDDSTRVICVLKRSLYDSRTYDLVNLAVCFVFPLLVISVLYCVICVRLCQSGVPSYASPVRAPNTPASSDRQLDRSRNSSWVSLNVEESSACCQEETDDSSKRTSIRLSRRRVGHDPIRTVNQRSSSVSHSLRVARARRKVIRLLVVVVIAFAVCNLPFHARKLWQYWSPNYDGASTWSAVFTIATTLVLYMNSGINPFLYAFLSANFRKSVADVCACRRNSLSWNRASRCRKRPCF